MAWFWRKKKEHPAGDSGKEPANPKPANPKPIMTSVPSPKGSREHKATGAAGFYQTPNVRPVPRRRSSKRGQSGGKP